MEFLVLTGFMLFVFTAFFFVLQERSAIQKHDARTEALASIASVIEQEVLMASQVHDGYSRLFRLPPQVDGDYYVANFTDVNPVTMTASEITIVVDDPAGRLEYLIFLPTNVTVLGNTVMDTTVIINKTGDVLYVGNGTGFVATSGCIPSCAVVCGGSTVANSCNFGCVCDSYSRGGTCSAIGPSQCEESSGCYVTQKTQMAICTADGSPGGCCGGACLPLSENNGCRQLVDCALTDVADATSCGGTNICCDGVCSPSGTCGPSETITCNFFNSVSTSSNTCSLVGNPAITCSGVYSCTIDITGTQNQLMTWQSATCQGKADTYFDETDNSVPFFCNS
jgi:hypothetical protein